MGAGTEGGVRAVSSCASGLAAGGAVVLGAGAFFTGVAAGAGVVDAGGLITGGTGGTGDFGDSQALTNIINMTAKTHLPDWIFRVRSFMMGR
jgi:hypothetical protein